MKSLRTAAVVLTLACLGDVEAGTIQESLDQAGPGSVVVIPPGTYQEAIRIPAGTFLVAEDPAATVLDGNGAAVVVSGDANSAIVGFTIRNGRIGVCNFSRFMGVFECTIQDFAENGIRIQGGSAAIANNVIGGNGSGTGIACLASNPYVTHNLIQSNGVGLLSRMQFIPVLEANLFRGNQIAIEVAEDSRVLSIGNIFDGNGVNFAGQPAGETDQFRAASEEELARVRGQKVEAYRALMQRVRDEAASMQPRIIYDLTDTEGRFGLICSFPWSVFHVASITRDTRIETYDAYDAQTDKDLNATAQDAGGRPVVHVSNPELAEKAHDRYVSEKIFIHPPSLSYQPDGTYVFNRTTNLGRIEIRAPAGFIIVTAPAESTLAWENGRHVARMIGNGMTTLRVVMTKSVPGS